MHAELYKESSSHQPCGASYAFYPTLFWLIFRFISIFCSYSSVPEPKCIYLPENISRRRKNSDTNKRGELGGARRGRRARGGARMKEGRREEQEVNREGRRVVLANGVPS